MVLQVLHNLNVVTRLNLLTQHCAQHLVKTSSTDERTTACGGGGWLIASTCSFVSLASFFKSVLILLHAIESFLSLHFPTVRINLHTDRNAGSKWLV